MLKGVAEPFRHTGLRFNPTGGITLDTMTDWLSYGPVNAVGGSWIAKSQDISEGNWEAIHHRAKTARAMADQIAADEGPF